MNGSNRREAAARRDEEFIIETHFAGDNYLVDRNAFIRNRTYNY